MASGSVKCFEDVTSSIQLDTGGDELGNQTSCIIVGQIVVLNVNVKLKSSLSAGANILKGLPRAKSQAFATASTLSTPFRMLINSYGVLKVDDAVSSGGWMNALFVYQKE